jgi:integrase
MLFEKRAPNTINHRISSLSGFFTFLREVSAEQRLPIQVPNPAHKDFIKREVALPVNETQGLSLSDARRLLQLPRLDSEIGKRDQAIIGFYLYTGARIGTGCRLEVHDFIDDPNDPKIKIQEKGKGASKRIIGFNQIAADILNAYLIEVGITSGKIFKKQLNPNSKRLGNAGLAEQAMYRIVMKYLILLPNAMQEIQLHDGSLVSACRYSPHSLRATTATLLLDAGFLCKQFKSCVATLT